MLESRSLMKQPFSPITLGESLKTIMAGGFVLTETVHQARQRLPPHCHELTNIAFVLDGSFTETLDRKSIECHPNSFLIKPPGQDHANHYGDRGMRCLLIEIHSDQLDALRPCTSALDHAWQVRNGMLSMLGVRIYTEFCSRDAATPIAIEGLLLELVATLSRVDHVPSDHGRPNWLKQAKEIFDAEFNEKITIGRVASTIQVHPISLARAFRKYLGCSPGQYVRGLRIDLACRELSRTNRPVAEIALTAGFADQAHFSRIFKAQTGLTPSDFRRAVAPKLSKVKNA